MTISQLNAAMAVLVPNASYSYQLDGNGNLVWIQFVSDPVQPGTCPTIEVIVAQIAVQGK